jgi:hypothetical protein
VNEATAALADEEALLAWVREDVALPATAEEIDGWTRLGRARAEAANRAAILAQHNRSTPGSDALLAHRVRLAELERRARR